MISKERHLVANAAKRVERVELTSELEFVRTIFKRHGVFGGQTIEWFGAQYSGKTGLLNCWSADLCQRGFAVAWIDTYKRLDPQSFGVANNERFWVIRPSSSLDSLLYAEMLIRSECFTLIVIEQDPVQKLRSIRRLQQLAKRHDVVLVWLHDRSEYRLQGVVAHRIKTVTRPKIPSSPSDEWGSAQCLVSLESLKYEQANTGIRQWVSLTTISTLKPSLWTEVTDRRTSQQSPARDFV